MTELVKDKNLIEDPKILAIMEYRLSHPNWRGGWKKQLLTGILDKTP